MDEKTKEEWKKGAEATLHGLGDVADVAGHVVSGSVKGAADGIETVSAHHAVEEEEKA